MSLYMLLYKLNLYLVYYPVLITLTAANYISKKLRHKPIKGFT